MDPVLKASRAMEDFVNAMPVLKTHVLPGFNATIRMRHLFSDVALVLKGTEGME